MQCQQPDNHNELPRHIAIVMDGNGRWAERRGLSRSLGHEQGSKAAEDIIRYASELGIQYVTLYAFSSENWQRPRYEIDAVMTILERYIQNDVNKLIENNIRVNTIGDVERLPMHLRDAVKDAVVKTSHCQKMTITLALSYGAWEELIYAIKNIATAQANGSITIDEALIRQYLYTNNLPDPDLFIRTGGEVRLSNFLLMQISYSELYFCKTLWPDFQRVDLDVAIKNYLARKRRFGNIA